MHGESSYTTPPSLTHLLSLRLFLIIEHLLLALPKHILVSVSGQLYLQARSSQITTVHFDPGSLSQQNVTKNISENSF